MIKQKGGQNKGEGNRGTERQREAKVYLGQIRYGNDEPSLSHDIINITKF